MLAMSVLEEPLLRHPTTPTAATTTPRSPTIFVRISAVLTLAALSVWANQEASKGIEITVLNSATTTPAGRRFNLMFVSNGRAARIVHAASASVERVLYPDHRFPRKPVHRITLQLASHNLSAAVSVAAGVPGGYVVGLSPRVVMSEPSEIASAVHRGVALVWLWNAQGVAPPAVLDALAMYLAAAAGFPGLPTVSTVGDAGAVGGCWPEASGGGEFVRYCEKRRPGFVARLNRGMEGWWRERAVEEALGSPATARRLCAAALGVAGSIADAGSRQVI